MKSTRGVPSPPHGKRLHGRIVPPAAAEREMTLASAILALLVFAACTTTEPPEPTYSIEVVSPIDTVVALGGTVQLDVNVRDQAGNILRGVQLNWTTSDPAIASVQNGLVTAAGTGTVTITASALRTSGSLRLRIVAANLGAISSLAEDNFANSLVAGLSNASHALVQTAFARCASGATAGNLVAVRDCIRTVRDQAAAATDATDRVLLAVLVLYADQIDRSLGL